MLNLRWSVLLGASISLSAFGCASDDTGGSGGGTGGSMTASGGNKGTGGATGATGGTSMGSAPAATVDAIKAFLAAGTYKMAPWKSDVTAPREALPNSASPHGKVIVWFNDTVQASAKAGNGKLAGGKADPPHTTGSMVVKEMFDAQGKKVGVAANLKIAGDGAAWAYYGVGDKILFNEQTGGAYTEASPFFKQAPKDGLFACNFCHSGVLFTKAP